MKVLIVSDTHGHMTNLRECVRRVSPIDMLIHCGDVEGQEEEIRTLASCETHIVSGNNDYFSRLPREDEFLIGAHKVFLTHGHNYGVSMGVDRIVDEAGARGADIVMFGHLHMPVVQKDGGIILVNPGSLTYPRQSNGLPSYIIMTVEDDGILKFAVRYIKVTGHGLEITG